MKILTFNAWGTFGPELKKRWKYASHAAAALDADIICLQEATDDELLNEFAQITNKKVLQSDCAETGLAVLTNLGVANFGLIPYSFQSPLESYYRKFIWAEINSSDTQFTISNTHLSWKPKDDGSRDKQVQELKQFMSCHGKNVLTGDFNCEYSSNAITVLKDEGYSDLLGPFEDAARPTWDNQNPFIQSHSIRFPDRRIDLILANREFCESHPTKTCKIVLDKPNDDGMYPSDHYGVLAEF